MSNFKLSRIDQFRQFKKEIRGNQKYLIVGIDIGKARHHAFFGTAIGHPVLKALIVENNLNLAIVRWCLAPDKIWAMLFEDFCH